MTPEVFRSPPIIREDGTRPWHERFFAIHGHEGESGACLWIGSEYSKGTVVTSVKEHSPDKSTDLIGYLLNPNLYFNSSETGYLDRKFGIFLQRGGRYLRSQNDKRFLHKEGYSCGRFWLGIARSPLPQDFYHPNSFWPDWAHLVHWEPKIARSSNLVSDREALEDFSGNLPQPDKVFSFVAGIIEENGYPADLQELTRLIIKNFGIPLKGAPKEVLYVHFPFLDPVISGRQK